MSVQMWVKITGQPGPHNSFGEDFFRQKQFEPVVQQTAAGTRTIVRSHKKSD